MVQIRHNNPTPAMNNEIENAPEVPDTSVPHHILEARRQATAMWLRFVRIAVSGKDITVPGELLINTNPGIINGGFSLPRRCPVRSHAVKTYGAPLVEAVVVLHILRVPTSPATEGSAQTQMHITYEAALSCPATSALVNSILKAN